MAMGRLGTMGSGSWEGLGRMTRHILAVCCFLLSLWISSDGGGGFVWFER